MNKPKPNREFNQLKTVKEKHSLGSERDKHIFQFQSQGYENLVEVN